MAPQFRWLADEETWLEDRVIGDGGRSKATDHAWTDTIVSAFQTRFPRASRVQHDGKMESSGEVDIRWRDVPRVRVCCLIFLLFLPYDLHY